MIGKNSKIMQLALKYGGVIALMYVVYFFIMHMFSLTEIFTLRLINAVILFVGLVYVIRSFLEANEYNLPFLDGFKLGFLTSISASAFFGFFVFVYLRYVDPEFMVFIQEHSVAGHYMNPYSAVFIILVEGVISGVIISFGIMQYYKQYMGPHPDDEYLKEDK